MAEWSNAPASNDKISFGGRFWRAGSPSVDKSVDASRSSKALFKKGLGSKEILRARKSPSQRF